MADKLAKELIELHDQWSKALREHDAETLQRILADDFHMVDMSGQIRSKTDYLKIVRAEDRKIHPEGQLKVRIDGDTGLVVGRSSVTLTRRDGTKIQKNYLYTDVFKHFDRGWQCIASHSSAVG